MVPIPRPNYTLEKLKKELAGKESYQMVKEEQFTHNKIALSKTAQLMTDDMEVEATTVLAVGGTSSLSLEQWKHLPYDCRFVIVADSYITGSFIDLWARHAKGDGSGNRPFGAFVKSQLQTNKADGRFVCALTCASKIVSLNIIA